MNCFSDCTHHGISCAACHAAPLRGARGFLPLLGRSSGDGYQARFGAFGCTSIEGNPSAGNGIRATAD